MSLTDIRIKTAKPLAKPYRLFDGGGLYLEVSPRGGKWWRLKYRFSRKEKRISLGTYPSTSLKDARDKRDAARRQLAGGIDPAAARKAEKEAKDDSVEAVAREWHEKQCSTWSTLHAETVMARLERYVFPWLVGRQVGEVTAPDVLSVLRRTEPRGAGNVAHRVHQDLGRVFQYAIATGRAERNPATDLQGALRPVKRGHHPAITDPKGVGELMRAIHAYRGSFVVQCALKLMALTFVRPGELRWATWDELALEDSEWCIPAERMKTRAPHIVPLSYQTRVILYDLNPLTGSGRYVFPGRGSRPMSENTLNNALRAMGFGKDRMTAHGFRAMARTLLDEVLGVRPDFIEHQLAHTVKDPLGRAYNRTQHLAERRRMMQLWADYLDGLKAGADVVPIRGEAS